MASSTRPAPPSLRNGVSWSFVRYASVWEDADVLCAALAPVAAGRRLLSIASAGDNVLALLTLDPEAVVAVDLSAAQLACLELRLAALAELPDDRLLAFLGVTPDAGRAAIYRALRGRLSARARGFWDAAPAAVEAGVIHAGKFERYFHLFRRRVLPLVHRAATVEALMAARSTEARRRFYDERWDTWRWHLLFRLFFSRWVMGRLGRDPAFFAHVEGRVADHILARTRYALTELPTHDNPYLTYILTGNYRLHALPRYLRPEALAAIRPRLDRVQLVEGPVSAALAQGPYHGFNLSDIFEYLSEADAEAVYGELLGGAAAGARLVYWNMLAPRACPAAFAGRVAPQEALAQALHRQDRAWFYQALRVEDVR